MKIYIPLLIIIACNSTPITVENIYVKSDLSEENTQEKDVEENFLITDTSVGYLKEGMTVRDFLKIYAHKKIEKKDIIDNYENEYQDYLMYDKNNQLLFTAVPAITNDESSKISIISIADKRYKTKKGIGISSTYSDLKTAYSVLEYETDVDHIIIVIPSLNASFSINKNYLLKDWWNEDLKQIDESKIPLNAHFDSFSIRWNDDL